MHDQPHLLRRDFVKLTLVGSAGAAVGCNSGSNQAIPLLVPDEVVPPGVAYWSRGVCRQCDAGCGVLVKRMDAEVPVEVNGQAFRQHRLVAKKLEGNPEHPLSRGALCGRGQAGLEATYHPERLRGALVAASRGSGQFQTAPWNEVLGALAARIKAAPRGSVVWAGRSVRGSEARLLSALLERVGAQQFEYRPFASPLAEASADAAVADLLPRADYLLSFGNFLETWPAQVSATRAYAAFRRGRQRGYFTQVEPRLSLTAANADRWVGVRPGSEGVFALAVAARLKAAVTPDLTRYTPEFAAQQCGVAPEEVIHVAAELSGAQAPLVIGGPNAYAYLHGAIQAQAVAELRRRAGGPLASIASSAPPAEPGRVRSLNPPLPPASEVLILDEVNPLFSAPPSWGIEKWLRAVKYVVVLGLFADETALAADALLPLSSALESWTDDDQFALYGQRIYSLNQPAMKPLHDTRSLIEIVLALSESLGIPRGAPVGASAEEAIRANWQEVYRRQPVASVPSRHVPASAARSQTAAGNAFEQFWRDAVARGGVFPAATEHAAAPRTPDKRSAPAGPAHTPPTEAFVGDATQYPYFLRVYESPVFGDGRWAHLSWLQELPDPTTSALWSTWVELHPSTAASLGVKTGDGVWVESPAGRIEVPAFVYIGIRPDTVAIPAGQGHVSEKAETARRGANVYTLLADASEPATRGLAWEATRVRLSRSGRELPLPLFGRSLRTEAEEHR